MADPDRRDQTRVAGGAGPAGSPHERRVVALQLRRHGDAAILEVRSRGRRGEFVREVRAPAMTATHAACAVARHYGLVRIDRDHWELGGRAEAV